MAALTIVLFAITSYGALAASHEVVTRIRDWAPILRCHGGLVVSAFVLPLVLGPATELLSRWIAPELTTAIAAVSLAFAG